MRSMVEREPRVSAGRSNGSFRPSADLRWVMKRSSMGQEVDQTSIWLEAGSRLKIEVIAPCEIVLSDGSWFSATALIKVGPRNGMVVDPAWSVLEPHADQLVADGFGYSAVEMRNDHAAIAEMLTDWGWRPNDR